MVCQVRKDFHQSLLHVNRRLGQNWEELMIFQGTFPESFILTNLRTEALCQHRGVQFLE